MENSSITRDKSIYFLSDAHLGATVLNDNDIRERRLVSFLEMIRPSCQELYLLGDIFDFWFEYKYVVPKGHVRFLAELTRFTDEGIKVHFFTGNHDIWAFDYLNRECGVILHTRQEKIIINGKTFIIGHGDGLNPRDKGYLFIRNIFHNPFLQKCFRLIHPDLGIALANAWSRHSRLQNNGQIEADSFRGMDKEEIVIYCQQQLQQQHIDYFIYGHRHLPLDIQLEKGCRYINTGDWITHFTYATFNGNDVVLHKYNHQ